MVAAVALGKGGLYDAHMSNTPAIQPPSPPSHGSDEVPPVTAAQVAVVAQAQNRAHKLRSVGRLAMFNGVMLYVFAGVSLLFAGAGLVFGEFDWVALVMGGGLGLLGWNELRGRRLLQARRLESPRVLGWNQLALMALIVAYAIWMLANAWFGPGPYEEAVRQEPRLKPMLGDIEHLHRLIAAALYGGLIIGTMVFQGLNALYYFSRAKLLRSYLAETPEWVIELIRAMRGIK
jgi:hypothetical protein